MHQFVNPSPNTPLSHILAFDFPADGIVYRATDCKPNINIDAPVTEAVYGPLGDPGKEQGHPCIKEYSGTEATEPDDPNTAPYQDQVLDMDREIEINFTGRLSGSFAKHLYNDKYRSTVKMFAHPLTTGGAPILLDTQTNTLNGGVNAPNSWFMLTANELIYTARARVAASVLGNDENVYKLIVKWEFEWYDDVTNPASAQWVRIPISGFDDAVSFEVIKAPVTI